MGWAILAGVLTTAVGLALACSSSIDSRTSSSGGASATGGAVGNAGTHGAGGSSTGGGVARAGGGASTGGSGGIAAGGSGGSSGVAGSSGTSSGDASVDAAGFCAGTAVAGTCLATFLAATNVCFRPSGACVSETAPPSQNFCWATGEQLTLQTGTQGEGFTYRRGGQLCFYGSWTYTNGNEKSYTFTADGNALLVYNRSTGETICADGSPATLAPAFGDCAAILALVDIDVSACAQGGC